MQISLYLILSPSLSVPFFLEFSKTIFFRKIAFLMYYSYKRVSFSSDKPALLGHVYILSVIFEIQIIHRQHFYPLSILNKRETNSLQI